MGRPLLHHNETDTISGHVDYIEDGCILYVMTKFIDMNERTHVYSDSLDRAAGERKTSAAHFEPLYSID